MIKKANYDHLRMNYGRVSSWAVWTPPYIGAPKSNTDDLSVFKSKDLLKILNPHYVFVGLNAASGHINKPGFYENDWSNFHSGYRYQHDYKIRYALMDTPYWGGYMTDVIKRYPEKDSTKVKSYLKSHPEVVYENIVEFKQELTYLDKHPVIIAFGGEAFNILNSYLGSQYTVIGVKHYSYTIGSDDYRKEVLDALKNY